jgi:uncharacterized membrane protein YgdD (TMEM256/DUF423 family)
VSGRFYIVVAALFGLTGVAAGALAAHGPPGVDPRALALVGTGASYSLWHAVAMLAYLGLWGRSKVPLALFAFGVALFSFSLYALAFGAPPTVAYATPLGGVALMLGWLAIAIEAMRDGFHGINDA